MVYNSSFLFHIWAKLNFLTFLYDQNQSVFSWTLEFVMHFDSSFVFVNSFFSFTFSSVLFLTTYIIWKYVVRCTISSTSPMQTQNRSYRICVEGRKKKLYKHKNCNSIQLKMLPYSTLYKCVAFIFHHLCSSYYRTLFFVHAAQRMHFLFCSFSHFTFTTRHLHGNELKSKNSLQRIHGKGNKIQ